MKDSKGREYDGWAMRYPVAWFGGQIAAYTFQTTRKALWSDFVGENPMRSRKNEMKHYRDMGFQAVKVRLEVVE